MSRPPALLRDTRGATIVEFAMVSPVMILMLMGLMELGYRGYVTATLQGALQKAARDSTIEGNNTTTVNAAVDQKVKNQVLKIAKAATFASERLTYSDFNAVGKPEKYVDANNNKKYDTGECFEDLNANSKWDKDMGRSGQGGPDDIVRYTMTVTYPRLFPLGRMLGWGVNQDVTASTLLKNQPYGVQQQPVYAKCT